MRTNYFRRSNAPGSATPEPDGAWASRATAALAAVAGPKVGSGDVRDLVKSPDPQANPRRNVMPTLAPMSARGPSSAAEVSKMLGAVPGPQHHQERPRTGANTARGASFLESAVMQLRTNHRPSTVAAPTGVEAAAPRTSYRAVTAEAKRRGSGAMNSAGLEKLRRTLGSPDGGEDMTDCPSGHSEGPWGRQTLTAKFFGDSHSERKSFGDRQRGSYRRSRSIGTTAVEPSAAAAFNDGSRKSWGASHGGTAHANEGRSSWGAGVSSNRKRREQDIPGSSSGDKSFDGAFESKKPDDSLNNSDVSNDFEDVGWLMECGKDDADSMDKCASIEKALDKAERASRRTQRDVDAEFEALLDAPGYANDAKKLPRFLGLLQPGKDCMPDVKVEVKETFSSRVYREQAHRDHLNQLTAAQMATEKPEGDERTSHRKPTMTSKLMEADVDETLARVRAKLDTVKAMRRTFLDEGRMDPNQGISKATAAPSMHDFD
mmetsp:Transcript_43610/g.123382  ORF Transcript_43610/g.123382 Transcript_43610/m.123382 type:complete len:489 (-) Transcript_43610:217-1683(-)